MIQSDNFVILGDSKKVENDELIQKMFLLCRIEEKKRELKMVKAANLVKNCVGYMIGFGVGRIFAGVIKSIL